MIHEKKAVIDGILANKLIVIIRGVTGDDLMKVVGALYGAGVRCAEITFDRSGKISDAETAGNISAVIGEYGDRMFIGAGTVMSAQQVRLARQAGAEFIISPDTCKTVIKETLRSGLVSIPGALTPTEVSKAHRLGADFVKLFPCGDFSPSYLKALAAPLSDVRFLAVGGITPDNLESYQKAGALGFGVSGSIIDKNAIENKDFEKIGALAGKFLEKLN